MNAFLALMGMAQMVALAAVLFGLPAATYYPFMFSRIRWWKSDIGKSMLMKGISLALMFWIALLSVPAALCQWSWFAWVQAGVDWFIAVAVWVQVLVMRRVQRDAIRDGLADQGVEGDA